MAGGRSTHERYLGARTSSNLRVVTERSGSADVLIAAGLVARGSERKSVALAVWGVLATEQMRGAHAVADLMGCWIHGRSLQPGQRVVKRVVASDVAMTVLKWYQKPACPECHGHGHPLMANSPVIDETRVCPACHGTGQIDMARLVRPEHVEHARWLGAEIEGLCSLVFSDVARKLSAEMNL